MKSNELTTTELMDMLKNSLREVTSMEVSNRNLPNALNRLKNTSQGCMAALALANYQMIKDKSGDASRVLIAEVGQIPKKLLK